MCRPLRCPSFHYAPDVINALFDVAVEIHNRYELNPVICVDEADSFFTPKAVVRSAAFAMRLSHQSTQGIVVIACTNEPKNILDKCLQRFNMKLLIDYLDAEGRAQLIAHELRANHIEIDEEVLAILADTIGPRSNRIIQFSVNTAVTLAKDKKIDVDIDVLQKAFKVHGSDYNADIHRKCKKYERKHPFAWHELM